MPGQSLPNPNARRRNKPGEWRDLPGWRTGRPPKPPRPFAWDGASEVWSSLWGTGVATAWTLADHWSVLRCAELMALPAEPKVSSEIRQLEDRLGLNPKGRAALRWRLPGEHGHPGDESGTNTDRSGPSGVVSLAERSRKRSG